MGREDAGRDAKRFQRRSADRADSRDDDAGVQGVGKFLRPAEVGRNLKEMPALDLAGERDGVHVPINQLADERPERARHRLA